MSQRKSKSFRREGVEHRAFGFKVEVRAAGATADPRLTGYAAVFNSQTTLIPPDAMWDGSPEVCEVLEFGAFTKTLLEQDVRAVWNHNTDIVLGRTGNNTLSLLQDQTGLAVNIDPPQTDLIRDMVMAPIERGDVNQMSFGFYPIRESYEEQNGGNTILIHVHEVQLLEVSPCTIPAYDATTIGLSARSIAGLKQVVEDFKLKREAAASTPGTDAHVEKIESEIVPTPVIVEHPEPVSAPPDTRHLDEDLDARFELAKRKFKLAA